MKTREKTPDIMDFYQQALTALPIRRIFSGVHVNNLKCTVMRSKSDDGAYDACAQLCNFYSDEVLFVWTQVPLNGLRADRVCLSWGWTGHVSIRCILGGVCSGVNCQLMVSWSLSAARGSGAEQITL